MDKHYYRFYFTANIEPFETTIPYSRKEVEEWIKRNDYISAVEELAPVEDTRGE